jgi:hypothetical protein
MRPASSSRNDSFQRERRRLLATLGGAALAAPFFLRELTSASAVEAKPPRRVVVFCTAMGTIKDHWVHPVGPLGTLGPLLAPLQPFVKDLNLILGDGGGVHRGGGHPAWGRLLTGLAEETSGPTGPGNGASIDQYLGKVIGAATRFPVLEFGAGLDYADGETFCRLIYADGKKSMTAEGDPKRMFERMYGMPPAAAEPQKPLLGPKATIDRLNVEIASLQSRLGGEERTKLDLHLAAIRDLEKQIAGLSTQSCSRPEPPSVSCGCDGSKREYMFVPQQTKQQLDLVVSALACDMTRVVSFQLGQEGNGSMRFPFLGLNGEDGGATMHFYSHGDRADDYVDQGPMYKIHLWYAEQFAYLVERLASVIESDGSRLLDNTWVLWLTPMGEGRRHDSERLPLVTAGSAGGAVRTGQSFLSKDRYINDLLATITHVMEAPIDTYGDAMLSQGPLAELLT